MAPIDETKAKPNEIQCEVALSKRHDGQIVSPSVQAFRRILPDGKPTEDIRVVLAWYDASDQTYTKSETFRGTTSKCEDWLKSKGVHLDAQGIH